MSTENQWRVMRRIETEGRLSLFQMTPRGMFLIEIEWDGPLEGGSLDNGSISIWNDINGWLRVYYPTESEVGNSFKGCELYLQTIIRDVFEVPGGPVQVPDRRRIWFGLLESLLTKETSVLDPADVPGLVAVIRANLPDYFTPYVDPISKAPISDDLGFRKAFKESILDRVADIIKDGYLLTVRDAENLVEQIRNDILGSPEERRIQEERLAAKRDVVEDVLKLLHHQGVSSEQRNEVAKELRSRYGG